MLRIRNLTKVFNIGTINEQRVLSGLNLHISEGDFVTLIGGNGAGKSTLLNLIAGVYMPEGGEILLAGEDITKMPEYKRAAFLGRVFQDPMMGTAADMEIIENLAIANRRGKRRGLGWGVRKEEKLKFQESLKILDLGLEHRLNVKAGLLSGGQRQALALLMATIQKPKLLLLDEHTAALDPKTAVRVLELTEELVEKNKLTTLMVTHNMKDAIKYGNRLIMMDKGKIVYDVSGEEKKNLKVTDLLEKFEGFSDRMLLA
ncbi:MAG: ABC transporter ATP-binding protein [Caldicoprobacterales bacterium]|jgi:putative ABC transport system ATP-binding protein|nr:ABC transporter ATP-binding protein [Clostridiales bacterium]